MAKRTIIWTKSADIQFVGILEYWLNRNKSNSFPKKLIKLTEERTNQIAENPELFKVLENKNFRVSVMGKFSIYYKVSDSEMIVVAFWDNRQDPDKLLKILQKKL
ncbi:MAG: type II toxin-antitoxin system RelE/ParE family toxin [Bacteroidetes bacterium]|nr:MAG: type II toxin-antitoxin system RelE/ParE family toxin [Bacteroidota bacterium]MBL1145801.1 type II toxin-antitoxin system RelE/ParE family toxin [Bacteroidota bacterium]NOG58595.1 type II toxin-antitoxin system RelE/ParE family toxin [Bacteroidota bacterium]